MSETLPRREFLSAAVLGAAASSHRLLAAESRPAGAFESKTEQSKSVPSKSRRPILLHQTDLFHPHGDPDDHFDLATLFALHLRGDLTAAGLILDYPPDHRQGDPDVMAAAQMNRLCASAIPAAVGAEPKMKALGDAMPELAACETAAIRLILTTLEEAPEPVAITCVGSATDIAVASLRAPDLFRTKCSGLYLDAGAAFPNPENPDLLEMNVRLNPLAYATCFALPCPLRWFPCWNVVERRESSEWGTFYWLEHAAAFDGISDRLKNFFAYMFEKTESPLWLRRLNEKIDDGRWNKILAERRGMWSTASILAAAGLTVTRDGQIVRADEIVPADTLYRMEPVAATCAADGRTEWKITSEPSERTMFHLLDPGRYPAAMARVVNSLLKTF